MASMNRERLVLEPLADFPAEIGLFLAALNDCRQRTKEDVTGIDAALIDRTTPAHPNSIGTLLYHIAAIEMDWLYCEILERDFPEDVVAHFPFDVRDTKGRLTAVAGLSLEGHLARLDATRAIFLEALGGMTRADFYRVRQLPHYDVTPAWVIHHLTQHEAAHRGQIIALRRAAERF